MQTLEQWINAYSPKQLYTNKNHLFSPTTIPVLGQTPRQNHVFWAATYPPPVINAAMRVPSVKRAEVVPHTPKWMDVRSMGRVEWMWYMFTTSISVQMYNYNIYILSKMQLQMQWPCGHVY